MPGPVRIADEVRRALRDGAPVVALETSVVAQGLPPPHGVESARRCAAAVRKSGAVPAAVAVVGGELVIGASDAEITRLAAPGRPVAKAGARDLGPLLAAGADAGTTVSATCAAAALAGIRIFATGGIGGVHRAAAGRGWDVSADLAELARSPVCVVSAGPKAILDVPATAELLETLGVPVVGYRTSELPAFWSATSGVALAHRVESAEEAARVLRLHWAVLRRPGGVLLAVPPPEPLAPGEVERAVGDAEEEATRAGIVGPARTPHVLAAVARATGGRTLAANLALLEENARVAGQVAVALASEAGGAAGGGT
jgi:pseudouridine-5'-phosphate glycosidase